MNTRLVALLGVLTLAGCPRPAPEGEGGGTSGATTCKATTCGTECIDTRTDAKHCGACEHDCQGGACDAGLCQRVVLATDYASALVADATHLYYRTTGDELVRIPNNGGVAFVFAYNAQPKYLALSDVNLYATANSTVYVVAKEGGTLSKIASDRWYPQGIVVNATDVYWVEGGDPAEISAGAVQRAPIHGAGFEVFAASQRDPRDIVLDETYVYWNSVGDSAVMRAPLAGGPATSLAANLPVAPIALALDVDHIYWRNLEGKVKRALKAGGEPTSVQTGAGFVTAIAVDEVDLYFVVTENSTLGRTSLATGAVTYLDTSSPGAATIALDAHAIYWNSGTTLLKVAK